MARTPEGRFQDKLLNDLRALFPDCQILKNDSSYQQGIPDLLILFRNKWALLEVKKSANERPRPNQPWFVAWGQQNSFGAFVYPENKNTVIAELEEFFLG